MAAQGDALGKMAPFLHAPTGQWMVVRKNIAKPRQGRARCYVIRFEVGAWCGWPRAGCGEIMPDTTAGNAAGKEGKMVGAARFELATFCSQSRRATRLRYAPTQVSGKQEPCNIVYGAG